MCGITGFIGPKDSFNSLMFKLLAWYQDERGGHGCGFAYMNDDEEVNLITSVATNTVQGTKFKDVVVTEENKAQFKHNRFTDLFTISTQVPSNPIIILAHARAATVGGVSAEFTQPFVVQTPDDIYVVVHNGTVRNWLTLKHELFTDASLKEQINNDSQLLAHAIAYDKLDVFEKYDGAATVMWYKASDPETMYMWLGTELHYSNLEPSKTPTRPLHMWQSPFGGIYFSSEAKPLFNIRYLLTTPETEVNVVWELPVNKICKINHTKDSLGTIRTVPRTKVYTQTNYDNSIGFNTGSISFDKFIKQNKLMESPEPDYVKITNYYGLLYQGYDLISCQVVDKITQTARTIEVEPIKVTLDGTVLYHSQDGLISLDGRDYDGLVYELYIFKGILMRNKESFLNYYKQFGKSNVMSPHQLVNNSAFPVYSSLNALQRSTSGYFYFRHNVPYTGTLTFPFGNYRYHFKDSIVIKVELLEIKPKNYKTLWGNLLDVEGIKPIPSSSYVQV